MFKISKGSEAQVGVKFILIVLVAIVTGCATKSGLDHVVEVQTVEAKQFRIDRDDYQASTELEGSILDPVIQYGSEQRLNSPIKRKYSSSDGRFSLDFVNIAIGEFVSIVFTEMLKKHYVLDDAIKGNVTVQTRGLINSSQLLSIIESVLASKSAVLIARKSHFELVPMAKAKNYSFKPELYSARNIMPGYRMVVVPVNFINPEDLKSVLESVAPSVSHLKIDQERRAIVVTGSEAEISNIVDTVQIFDVSWLQAKSIALLPIENAEASTVQKEIGKILNSQNKSHTIVLDTFDRFNALLVVARHKTEIDAVRKWVDILDVRVPTSDTQLFVYKVQNRKASELTDILNGIFNEEAAGVVSQSEIGGNSQDLTASTKEVVVTNKKTLLIPEQLDLESSALKFVADETNNAIIILAKETEYKRIKSVIDELDTLPLQVLIEVSIVEVTLTDELSYGVEWFLKHNGVADKFNTESLLDLNAGSGLGPIIPGFSFLLSGEGSLVQAVFNTLAEESKLDVLSSPSLMALDNHTATIRVGNQQPVQTSSTASANNDVLTQSIEFKSTGVLLSVTPRVNSGGLVTMELSQEVTDVGNIDIATGQRSFLQRNLNSTVAVQSGRSIVLGGLITENTIESQSGVPGLYKLPLIGWMFGKTTTSTFKSELIVLITPRIIANHQNASLITAEYAEKMGLLKSSLKIQK